MEWGQWNKSFRSNPRFHSIAPIPLSQIMTPKTRFPSDRRCALVVGAALVFASATLADVTLAPLFRDGAVLQRDKPLPVWGRSAAGEKIEVRFHNQVVTSVADSAGRWRVVLAPEKGETQPAELVVAGNNTVRVTDVRVGEVWLCSGQSNMEWMLSERSDWRRCRTCW